MKAFYENIEYYADDWCTLHKFLDDLDLLRQLRIDTIRIKKNDKWIKFTDICNTSKNQDLLIKELELATTKENMWERLKC